MAPKILFITSSPFLGNTAMHVRYCALAKLFQHIGFDVLVLTRGSYTKHKVCIYDNIPYISVSGKHNNKISNFIDYRFRILSKLKELDQSNDYKYFLIFGTNPALIKYLQKMADRGNSMLISDRVDWFSPEQFVRGKADPSYKNNEFWITKVLNTNWAVISITNYFHNYFVGRKIKSARIPVIMDIEKIEFSKNLYKNKIIVSYAGAPGKKDYLKEIVEGCALLNESERAKIEIRLIGIAEEQLVSMCGVAPAIIEKVKANLCCLGRIPRAEVLEKLKQSDFTILIRPPQARYAQAGFPTKVVESLAGGTPVICNLTSDLGMYIRDMQNGIVVDGCTAEAVCAALKKAVDTTYDQRMQMCRNARLTAEENFDYRKYAEPLNRLIVQYQTNRKNNKITQ